MGRSIHLPLSTSAWHVTGQTHSEGTRYSILSLCPIKIFPPVPYLSGHPNPRSRVLLEKSAIPQLDNKFPAFYGTRMSITAFTNSQPLVPILSHVNPVQALPTDLYSLISSSGINLGLSRALSFSLLHQNPVCTPPLFHMSAKQDISARSTAVIFQQPLQYY